VNSSITLLDKLVSRYLNITACCEQFDRFQARCRWRKRKSAAWTVLDVAYCSTTFCFYLLCNRILCCPSFEFWIPVECNLNIFGFAFQYISIFVSGRYWVRPSAWPPSVMNDLPYVQQANAKTLFSLLHERTLPNNFQFFSDLSSIQ
jgi:hypothetical protein